MDGDFTLMQQMHEQESKEASNGEVKGTAKAVDEVVSSKVEVEDGPVNTESEEAHKDASAVTSDLDPTSEGNSSLQVVESEQATYASANNDLKGTKAYNNADVTGLYTLAMAIIDYRGHRIVAQVAIMKIDINA